MLCRLIYLSDASPGSELELSAILESAHRSNPKLLVTGALFFDGKHFAQVIEGPLAAIESLYQRIEADPRHHDVRQISVDMVNERWFGDWSMGYLGPDTIERDLGALGLSGSSLNNEETVRNLIDWMVRQETLVSSDPIQIPQDDY